MPYLQFLEIRTGVAQQFTGMRADLRNDFTHRCDVLNRLCMRVCVCVREREKGDSFKQEEQKLVLTH